MTPRVRRAPGSLPPEDETPPPVDRADDYTSGDLLIIEKCRKYYRMMKDLRVEEKGHKHQAKACREQIAGLESEIEELLGTKPPKKHDPAQMRLPAGDRG